jgi:hypothetical protein
MMKIVGEAVYHSFITFMLQPLSPLHNTSFLHPSHYGHALCHVMSIYAVHGILLVCTTNLTKEGIVTYSRGAAQSIQANAHELSNRHICDDHLPFPGTTCTVP